MPPKPSASGAGGKDGAGGGDRRTGLRWHLLVHALPPKPLYLRAKVRNRLERSGAVALKNAVYALPRRSGCLAELRSIAEDAIAGGGRAYVCDAVFLEPETDAQLVEEFRDARDADYAALAEAVGRWGQGAPGAAALVRARKRFDEIVRIDFFDLPARRRTEALLARAETRTKTAPRRGRPARGNSDLAGRVWSTRPGVQIDRIASAWLIRRFIDPAARFRFADPKDEARPGEIRFDVAGGDFTHEEDRCTFETLARRIEEPDPALREIAEIVHDVDLKDGKFARPDAAGVQQIVLGIVLGTSDDEERFRRGFAMLDDLYASFRRKTRRPAAL